MDDAVDVPYKLIVNGQEHTYTMRLSRHIHFFQPPGPAFSDTGWFLHLGENQHFDNATYTIYIGNEFVPVPHCPCPLCHQP